ncbi:isoprenoid synthase domain-containing protein [Cokeromyces recurvatus]|uniref:isoprenoid synthase domain-containing protein n=1 Tax=Cokeromyces recurvatus TaxID=90255 RepID=UPI0022202D9B|nr:isoprenoid synthase domain-containing protein [Cokeromyces recurvatus]KAI7897832.1 isoprenoid synthase domain-containing protein [Cokeromyces recurvatus]
MLKTKLRIFPQLIIKRSHSTISPERVESALTYCKNLVRQRDYEGYLCVPFFPAELRNTQYAIRAFNVELASVRENVSKVEIGKMRMQFWKDVIDRIYAGHPPEQPIALALAEALKTSKLSAMWLKRMISERSNNLDDHQFMTIKDMETYSENTQSSLLYLELESLNIKDINTDHAVSHIGKMIGISTFLRSIPFHISQKRLVLPAEITAKHDIVQENIFRGEIDRMEDAVFDVATATYDHLLTARSLINKIPAEAFPVLLSAVPHVKFLEKLEKVNFNIFDTKLQKKDWKLPLIMYKSYKTGNI